MNKIKANKESGFSLVSVIIAVGMLGLVASGVMSLMKNISDGQSRAEDKEAEISLTHEIRSMLHNNNYCKVSLRGLGFQKSEIDSIDEGLPIQLWTADQDGINKETLKFSGSTITKRRRGKIESESATPTTYDKLTISSIKLIMPNGKPDTDYKESDGHIDQGYIRVTVEKKVGGVKREILLNPPNGFLVNVNMRTNRARRTIIQGCDLGSDSVEFQKVEGRIIIVSRDYKGSTEKCSDYFDIGNGLCKTDVTRSSKRSEWNDRKCYAQARAQINNELHDLCPGLHIVSLVWKDEDKAELIIAK